VAVAQRSKAELPPTPAEIAAVDPIENHQGRHYCYDFGTDQRRNGINMIIRVFRAKIRKSRVSDFKQMVLEQSIPWLEKSDGMLGYFPGEPYGSNEEEFLMVTLWRDLESLEAFAGPNWDDPIVTDDEAPLVEAMFADHYCGFGKEDL